MTRRVVITADDLGREPGTTEVIVELLAEGQVSATTLICVSPEAERAAGRVAETGVVPRLHVTLTSERGLPRWRPLDGPASLADPDGTLSDDPYVLGARGEAGDVIREADAQLRWMRERGLAPVAADSHAGTLYGLHGRSWLAEALAWCARHGLAFRLPRDPEPYFGGPSRRPSPPPTNSPSPTPTRSASPSRRPSRRTGARPASSAPTSGCGTITCAGSPPCPRAPASCSCTRPARTRSGAPTVSCGSGRRGCCATPCGTRPWTARTSRSPEAGGPDRRRRVRPVGLTCGAARPRAGLTCGANRPCEGLTCGANRPL
ncbi:ChbG/HpnK family deacetylase [Nonomuraea rubra]|uniref:ChbG/HpnK family deacetylase n=1 Tax=Nonomuraea rubra TaxID=46180 RepID=UPI00361F0E44